MKKLENLTLGLFGFVLLLFAFKKVDFFLTSEVSVFILKVWILISILITCCSIGKLVGIKFQHTIFLLIGIELFFYISFQLASNRYTVKITPLSFLRFMYMEKCRNIIQFDPNCASYDEQLFYTLKPGRNSFSNIEFDTKLNVNSAGFRDDEISLNQPSIVFLGDSFTMGWGVEQDETFVEILENKLNRKCLNMGISSYGTAREVIAACNIDLKKADLVVLQYGVLDEQENREFVLNDFQLPISTRNELDRHQHWNSMWKSWFPLKYCYVSFFSFVSLVKKWLINEENIPEIVTELSDQNLEDIFSILAKFREVYKGNIVLLNFCQYGRHNIISQQFSDWIKVQHIENVWVFNTDKILSEDDFFVIDDHLNAKGHSKVANLLHNFITEKELLAPK